MTGLKRAAMDGSSKLTVVVPACKSQTALPDPYQPIRCSGCQDGRGRIQ
jgi:hypothetical protein